MSGVLAAPELMGLAASVVFLAGALGSTLLLGVIGLIGLYMMNRFTR